jgi:ParB-like chromosome segregation protein Spo0J
MEPGLNEGLDMFSVHAIAELMKKAAPIFDDLAAMDVPARIQAINRIKLALHEVSPMRDEPVDCVLWVPSESVVANDYNPNAVAPPEMQLLELSITEDGYTQPIVTFAEENRREVVDGFHRHRVGRECKTVRDRVHGYLPVTTINEGREDRGDRIAATIRHNRARGKHKVEAMSDIVVELKRRNWSNEKIGKQLGMDPDEVLRLCQVSGLAEMFADREFSEAWESDAVNAIDETDTLDVTQEIPEGEIEE